MTLICHTGRWTVQGLSATSPVKRGKNPVIIRHRSFERGVLKENGVQLQLSPTRWRVGYDLCLTWQLLVVSCRALVYPQVWLMFR